MKIPSLIPRLDLVWLTFDPQAGHEQRGRRPALILSPRPYKWKGPLKWLGNLAMLGGLAVAAAHYVRFGRKESSPESREKP